MSHGALIQLAAQGVENIDLTVDAEHTFFKSQYAKHTGFAMEPKELTATSGTAQFGNKLNFKIDRQGDLLADMWLVFHLGDSGSGGGLLSAGHRYTNDIGRALIDTVSVKIGGVIYDTRIGEYYHANEELTVPDELHLNKLTGKSEVEADLRAWALEVQMIYVPISFWFTDAYASSLPLVGLYQHDVQVEFVLRPFTDCVHRWDANAAMLSTSTGQMSKVHLLCEYVFLENNERNYFSRGSHKWQLEQVQHVGTVAVGTTGTLNVDLNFNHPTSELIFFARQDIFDTTAVTNANGNNYFNFEGTMAAPFRLDVFSGMRLLLNNSERWTARDPLYFRQVVPRRSHSRIPRKHIYAFSFALHPENSSTDPSGNINFSRIDNSQLRFTFDSNPTQASSMFIFARSSNWTKIERGLAKLFYA